MFILIWCKLVFFYCLVWVDICVLWVVMVICLISGVCVVKCNIFKKLWWRVGFLLVICILDVFNCVKVDNKVWILFMDKKLLLEGFW